MSQSRVDTDGLSQCRLLMLHAAGSPVCLCRLIFPAGFSFKALRWAFKRLLRQHWRPPSDFPFLSPPVRCPFQWLIYGPHKCARDAEISEEVINRTKLRKRGGKRKQTEEVTGTCGVKARAWERLWLITSVSFTVEWIISLLLYLLYLLSVSLISFHPVSWPLNSRRCVCLPLVYSPNWSQDADALAGCERHAYTPSLLDWNDGKEEDHLKEKNKIWFCWFV